uniref:Uncharacterized protein n=1 Tax=Myotis myotis TaxID=51298 RepID=A0A7J7S1Z1_MYOMY|nr:hypothetical protein mMyoMyo1_010038 [Myotis myotis]
MEVNYIKKSSLPSLILSSFFFPSFYSSIRPSIYPSIHPSIHPSIYPSGHLHIFPFYLIPFLSLFSFSVCLFLPSFLSFLSFFFSSCCPSIHLSVSPSSFYFYFFVSCHPCMYSFIYLYIRPYILPPSLPPSFPSFLSSLFHSLFFSPCYPPIHPSILPSFPPSIYHLSTFYVFLPTLPPTYPSVYHPSLYSFIHPSIHSFIHPSIHSHVYSSVLPDFLTASLHSSPPSFLLFPIPHFEDCAWCDIEERFRKIKARSLALLGDSGGKSIHLSDTRGPPLSRHPAPRSPPSGPQLDTLPLRGVGIHSPSAFLQMTSELPLLLSGLCQTPPHQRSSLTFLPKIPAPATLHPQLCLVAPLAGSTIGHRMHIPDSKSLYLFNVCSASRGGGRADVRVIHSPGTSRNWSSKEQTLSSSNYRWALTLG